MAYSPCESCGSRYLGPAGYVYPALMAGSTVIRERYRLCPKCHENVIEHVLNACAETDPGIHDQADQDTCGLCDRDIHEGDWRHFFVTIFRARDQRIDAHLLLCEQCSSTTTELLQGRRWGTF